MVSFCSSSLPKPHYVGQADPELKAVSLLLAFWDHRHEPPPPALRTSALIVHELHALSLFTMIKNWIFAFITLFPLWSSLSSFSFCHWRLSSPHATCLDQTLTPIPLPIPLMPLTISPCQLYDLSFKNIFIISLRLSYNAFYSCPPLFSNSSCEQYQLSPESYK